MDEALELTNAYAPEHLIVETENYLEVAERVINAGSVFLGSLTPESAGDYASGTNHTLPTNGYAKTELPDASASTSTSEGPAGMSMATSRRLTNCLAAVTY